MSGDGPTALEWAVAWRLAELTPGWRRSGYRGECAPHHFADLASKRRVAHALNQLAEGGVTTARRDSRNRKTWTLAETPDQHAMKHLRGAMPT